jgi:hypothetical protein
LALQPDLQKKLQCEIDKIHQATDGKVTYNDIQAMKYMDMVVSGKT